MRKTRSGKCLEVNYGIPVANRGRNLRRSVRFERCSSSNVSSSPAKVDLFRQKYARKSKNKKQELLGFENELSQENANINEDHDEQPPDAVGDVGLVEISSSEEGNKPEANPLLMLKHASKPNPQLQLEPGEHETLLDAAAILKSRLVSALTNPANKLTVSAMVYRANKCFKGLKALNVEYSSFHTEIRQLIELHYELDLATKEKNKWNGFELEHVHQKCVANHHEAEEELLRAQNVLSCLETRQDLLRTVIRELTETLSRLKDEEAMGQEKIKTLIAERDRLGEACLRALHEVKRSNSKMEEAAATMEMIKARCDSAKEGIERMLHPLHRFARK